MTVQELINELQKIEDKEKPVKVYGAWSKEVEEVVEVEDYSTHVYIGD